MARFFVLALFACMALASAVHASFPTAHYAARSLQPAHLFERGGSDANSLQNSISDLANQAANAVQGGGACSTNSTCGGFINTATTCSNGSSNASIAQCICGPAALNSMSNCATCLGTSSAKSDVSNFSSFCTSASSTLAALAATSTTSSTPSATSTTTKNSASKGLAYAGAGLIAGVAGAVALLVV
ncbi:hypothetical protein JCM1841_005895 [Sporobolomyces salmonicolor]